MLPIFAINVYENGFLSKYQMRYHLKESFESPLDEKYGWRWQMTLMLYALCLLNYPYFHSMYIFTRVLIINLSHCIWAPNTFCSSSCSYYIKNKNNTSMVFFLFCFVFLWNLFGSDISYKILYNVIDHPFSESAQILFRWKVHNRKKKTKNRFIQKSFVQKYLVLYHIPIYTKI